METYDVILRCERVFLLLSVRTQCARNVLKVNFDDFKQRPLSDVWYAMMHVKASVVLL